MTKNCTKILCFLLTLSICSLLPVQVWAQQEREEMDTDRPDQSQGPGVVPRRMVQLETGYLYQQRSKQVKVRAYPTALLRIGLTDRVELRVQGARKDSVIRNGAERRSKGFGPLSLGTKVRLWEESGWRPEAALMAMVALPVASKAFRPDSPEPQLNLGLANQLSEKTELNYNVGYGWTGGDAVRTYGANIMREVAANLKLYLEVFGSKEKDSPMEHETDLGLLFLLFPNVQFDVAAGRRLNRAAPHSFVTAGLALRLPG